MFLIVLVHGIDERGQSKVAQREARTKLFREQFPKAEVKDFDFFYEQGDFLRDGYARDKAKAIIKHLQQSANQTEPERIIFVARNTGAALVKQILLIALEDHRHLWITFKTVGLYFIESPSYLIQYQWEHFVLRLLATDQMLPYNLSVLVSILPKALTRIQFEFMVISYAFETQSYGGDLESQYDPDKDPWNSQDDKSRLGRVFLDMRSALRRKSTRLQTVYQDFIGRLSRPDASINRLNALITVLPKFMTWLETHPSYKSWLLDDKSSSVLSITGPKGSGNSYLSSHILHMLLAQYRGSETLFLSYSFYRWDIRRNSERTFVLSMIRQLLTLRPGFYKGVEGMVTLLSSEPSIPCGRLWGVFRYLLTISRHSRLFLIVNGVDQCLQPIAAEVGLLATIPSMKILLKTIMTSSTTLEMPENVSHHRMLLKDSGWEKVIRSIAEERALQIVDERPVWKDSQNAIVEKLCSGEYTYLSINLNLDVLAHSKIPSTKGALKEQLMSPILSEKKVFNTMVGGLDNAESAKLALNWIFHAVRPLTVSELAVALTLKPDPLAVKLGQKLTFDVLIQQVSWDLMRDLGGLLETTVKIVDDRVYFAHHPFRDYFKEHKNLIIPNFHASITEWCLSYLSLCSEYEPKVSMEYDSLQQPHIGVVTGFLRYADLYWPKHYKLTVQTSSTQEQDEVSSFAEEEERRTLTPEVNEKLPLDEKGEQVLDEKQELILGKKSQQSPEGKEELSSVEKNGRSPERKREQSLDEKVTQFITANTAGLKKWVEKCTQAFGWIEDLTRDPLFLASQLGFGRIVHNILRDETGISPERASKAATIAARTGNTEILEDVLEVAEGSAIVDSLRAAAEYGQTAIIELLLAKIYDSGIERPNADEDLDSPLLLAALNGHTAAFEILLLNGYSMKALDTSKNTVAHLASQIGDVNTLLVMKKFRDDTFRLLMTSTNESDMSPLQLTCVAGSMNAFELVLDNSPEDQLHLAKGDSMSPIQLAAQSGHLAIVEKLIKAGANVTVGFDFEMRTPVELAAKNGHYDVVCCLVTELEKLVIRIEDPKSTDFTEKALNDCLESSLLNAISFGKMKVIKFLLPKTKRDAEADRKYIRHAVGKGQLDIIKFLVANGIPVKLPEGDYNRLLDIAVREDFVDIVSYLTNEGVTPQWDGQETSIHYATSLGYKLCLRELLHNADDKDFRKRDYQDRTALEVAANSCRLDTFKELLAWEKDRVLLDQPWRPAPKLLVLAIENQQEKMMKIELVNFLINNGWTLDLIDGSPDIPLHAAVKDGDIDIVQLLLNKLKRINAIDHRKETALHIAVRLGRTEIAGILLRLGADPNIVNSDDLTPLHVAIKEENDELVRLLLGLDIDPTDTTKKRSRANVEKETPDGSRALHFAHNSSTITSILLDLDPKQTLDPVRKASKITPLILAASEGSDDVVLLLLKAGANVDSKDSMGRTALHHAAGRDEEHIDSTRHLIEKKANPNIRMNDQSTPLYAAVRNGNDKIAAYLLEKTEADPNLYGGILHSPLQAATFRGELDISTRLLQAGANPNAQGGLFGSPLHAAMLDGNLELITLLLSEEYKASTDLIIPPFGTPLHALSALDVGSSRPSREIAALLIEHDAAMLNCKIYNQTPLMIALSEEESFMLIALGANLNIAKDSGATTLHYAAAFQSLTLVQKLLEGGAKVDVRDKCRRSVLYFAALSSDEAKFKAVLDKISLEERKTHLSEVLPAALKMRSKPIFDLIIKEESIDCNVPDHSGWTGLDVAKSCEMLEEADALEALGAKRGPTKREPTEWCSENKDDMIVLSDDKMEARIDAVAEGFDDGELPYLINASVRANHCIPIGKGIFYFEVEILECGKNSAIAVGLSSERIQRDIIIGWVPGTLAYHSDDGSILRDSYRVDSASTYYPKQIVGLAVDRTEKQAWFTLDGIRVGQVMEGVVGQLYPAVSFQEGYSKVKVNFGMRKDNSMQFEYKPEGGLRTPDSPVPLTRRRTWRRHNLPTINTYR